MSRLSPHPSRHAPLRHATAFSVPVRLPPHTQPIGRPALWPIPSCPFAPCYSIPGTGPPPSPHTANRKTCLMARPAMSLGTSREHLLDRAVSLPAMQRLLQPQLMRGGSPFGERRYIYVFALITLLWWRSGLNTGLEILGYKVQVHSAAFFLHHSTVDSKMEVFQYKICQLNTVANPRPTLLASLAEKIGC
jgi:hypothetical protein